MRKSAVGLLFFLASCSQIPMGHGPMCDNAYYTSSSPSDAHVYRETGSTHDGVIVDYGEASADSDAIDRLTAEFEDCIGQEVVRCGIRVKIVRPDIGVFSASGVQVFPCGSDYCQGRVEEPNIVVVTPDLDAYKHELAHLVAGGRHGDAYSQDCTEDDVFYDCTGRRACYR